MKIELGEREQLIVLAALMSFEMEMEKDPGWTGLFSVSVMGGSVINGQPTIPPATLDEVKSLTERYWELVHGNSEQQPDPTAPAVTETIPAAENGATQDDADEAPPARDLAGDQPPPASVPPYRRIPASPLAAGVFIP